MNWYGKQDENIWLTQKMIATLYDVEVNTINYHIKKIFSDGSLKKREQLSENIGQFKPKAKLIKVAKEDNVIDSLDLSSFNIIDCDSYGIPFDVIYKLLNNPTLQKETVIIYTAITNQLSGLNKECLKMFNLQRIYAKSHSLIASQALALFHGMLYKFGIKEVEFFETKENFIKQYGFFKVV